MALTKLNLEKKIVEKYVLGLRAIFESDDTFSYNDNDSITNLMITPEYPKKDATFKTPHMVVTNVSYSHNRSSTFNHNYSRDIVNGQGVHVGREYVNTIPYSLNIPCLGEYFTSKDLANTLMAYLSFDASEIFDWLKLNIQNVSKSPTSPQKQYAEPIFETIVSVQGYLEFTGTKTFDTITVLNKIKANEQQFTLNENEIKITI